MITTVYLVLFLMNMNILFINAWVYYFQKFINVLIKIILKKEQETITVHNLKHIIHFNVGNWINIFNHNTYIYIYNYKYIYIYIYI